MNAEVLQVRHLHVHYQTHAGPVKAVDDVNFSVNAAEKVGLVGESGCGKSTLIMALMRLIKPPCYIRSGEVILDGVNLVGLSNEEMRRVRFEKVSLIPQGAMNSLNPVMRINEQMLDIFKAHRGGLSMTEMVRRVQELLEWVGLEKHVAGMYPHELSGGMKQRVCIAMAISLMPKLVIADEPTSALDVVVQRQVIGTLDRVQKELGLAVILSGHDIALMAQFVDRLAVMYAGKLVEVGPVTEMFEDSLHPYTEALIGALPSLESKALFRGIPGITPTLLNPQPGCLFCPRCPQAGDECPTHVPPLVEVRPGRFVACHRQTERG